MRLHVTSKHSSESLSESLGGMPTETQRLISLDVIRGFDMFWIIGGEAIVKGLAKVFPGKVAETCVLQLEHVPWEGLHFYDVIWPLFMFIVGVAMRLSLNKRRSMGVGNQTLYSHAVKRALILFFLGMVAQGNLLAFDLSKLHPCYSVLHGIAAGYLIATIVMVNLRPLWQAIVSAGFLLGYWALLMLLPVPGFGRGVLTPEGNAAAYIDRLVLGGFHYGMNTWFLSYLGFASSVLLGVLAGELLLSRRSARNKIAGLFITGTALLILGLAWSLWLPIIKLLWTSSYVLVTGGISFLLLCLFYTIVDVLKWRKWAFGFAVIGMNSLAVYMATMLFNFRHIGNIFVGSLLPRVGNWNGFLEATAGFTVVWLILYWMYRTKSFVRL
jgi:predicted acyltransferase